MTTNPDSAVMAMAEVRTPSTAVPLNLKAAEATRRSMSEDETTSSINSEDLHDLRRVSGKISWISFTIAFVELCERFSYYGTTVVFTNFLQQPLPKGSTTGAGFNGQSGALGMGQRASTGLGTFNQFWAYLTPLFGAYIADAHLGRYKTIHVAIIVALVGHAVLTASAAPSVIVKPHSAIAAFAVGLIIFGIGTGLFKSNISPLLAEQQVDTKMRIETTAKGERVIVDPAVTTSRIFLYFYMCINVGSLTGQIAMVYAEKYVGFYLSFLLPTVLFLIAPFVLLAFKKKYILSPPTGSVLSKFFRVWTTALRENWSHNSFRGQFSWDIVRPSKIPIAERPTWMNYDDAWIEEVRRGLKACKVFLFLPLYWLAYGQMTNNLTSQAATMNLHGAPNDIIQNLNPISIVIMIPIFDFLLYPALRKAHVKFTPIKRMACGFMCASAAMVAAAIIQYYIYKLSPCGKLAATCRDADDNVRFADINVWVQAVPYVLIGISEIFTSITGLEYAFSKAPTNMRSFVMSINLLMNAFSSALAQALVALANDPLLEWNYGVVAVLAFIGGALFWFCFHKLDRDEDKWNMLQETAYMGRRASVVEPDPEREDGVVGSAHKPNGYEKSATGA